MKIHNASSAALASLFICSCVSGSALQPDRAIFSLDNNYQRYYYENRIENTLESALIVFRDAGYSIDVVDRATGQISGVRGASGENGSRSDKDLKFYALVIPSGSGSELAIKIVQVLKSGALGTTRSELIVNDPQMYQYVFRRIENINLQTETPAGSGPTNDLSGELPTNAGSYRGW